MQNFAIDCLELVFDYLEWSATELHNLYETCPAMCCKVAAAAKRVVYDNVEGRPSRRFPRLKSMIYLYSVPKNIEFPATLTELRAPFSRMDLPPLPLLRVLDVKYNTSVVVSAKKYPLLHELVCLEQCGAGLALEHLTLKLTTFEKNLDMSALRTLTVCERMPDQKQLIGLLSALPNMVRVVIPRIGYGMLGKIGILGLIERFEQFDCGIAKWNTNTKFFSINVAHHDIIAGMSRKINQIRIRDHNVDRIYLPPHITRLIVGYRLCGDFYHCDTKFNVFDMQVNWFGAAPTLDVAVEYVRCDEYKEMPMNKLKAYCSVFEPKPSNKVLSLQIHHMKECKMDFPRLVKLHLWITKTYSHIHEDIAKGCPSLERLIVKGKYLAESAEFQFPPRVKHLTLDQIGCTPTNLQQLPAGLITLHASMVTVLGAQEPPLKLPASLAYVYLTHARDIVLPRRLVYLGGVDIQHKNTPETLQSGFDQQDFM